MDKKPVIRILNLFIRYIWYVICLFILYIIIHIYYIEHKFVLSNIYVLLFLFIPIILYSLFEYFEKKNFKLWLFIIKSIFSIIIIFYYIIIFASTLFLVQSVPIEPYKWQYPSALRDVKKIYNFKINMDYFPEKIPDNAKNYEAKFEEGMLMNNSKYYVKFDIDDEYIDNVIEENYKRRAATISNGEYVYNTGEGNFHNNIRIPDYYDIYLLKSGWSSHSCGFAISGNTILFFMEVNE